MNKERCKRYRRNKKIKIMTMLCGGNAPVCSQCGEKDIAKLEINHLKGYGNDHREALFGHNWGSTRFYRWLEKNFNWACAEYDVRCKAHNLEYDKQLRIGEPVEVGPADI